MISTKYNTIKSYYAKSAMREKKRWNRMWFNKTQEFLKHSILITLKFINSEFLQRKQTNLKTSHPEVFLGRGGLKICSNFTEKHSS